MSNPAGGGLAWVKSSHSVAANACVELARAGDLVALRDSKNPEIAPFLFTHAEFAAFLGGAKCGEFDHFVDSV